MLEVVVAVGIFAGAIVVVIAMLAGSLRSESDLLDQNTASRLTGAVNTKLDSLGYNTVQNLLFDASQNPNSQGIDTTSNASKVLFINKTGEKIGVYTDPIWGPVSSATDAEKYYEVMLVRTPSTLLSPRGDNSGATLNSLTAASVLFTVRVTWPAHTVLSDGTVAPHKEREQRSVFVFSAAVAR